MSYKLVFSKTALKEIKNLDSIVKKKLGKKIKQYSKAPFGYAKRLADTRMGTYRWRIGNYRIIFDIKGSNIMVLRVGHRREIYK